MRRFVGMTLTFFVERGVVSDLPYPNHNDESDQRSPCGPSSKSQWIALIIQNL